MKVVITGLNIISALGLNCDECWSGLSAGKSGIRMITMFDSMKNDTRIAGQLPDGFEEYGARFCKKRIAGQMTRVTRMAFVCAAEAIERSGLDFTSMDRWVRRDNRRRICGELSVEKDYLQEQDRQMHEQRHAGMDIDS